MVHVKNMLRRRKRGAMMAIGTAFINPQHVFARMTFCTVLFSVMPTRFKIFFTGVYQHATAGFAWGLDQFKFVSRLQNRREKHENVQYNRDEIVIETSF